MRLVIIISIFLAIDTYANIECINQCQMESIAVKMSKQIKFNYLKKHCRKPIDYLQLKNDLEKSDINPFSLLHSKGFMDMYCSQDEFYHIEDCLSLKCRD